MDDRWPSERRAARLAYRSLLALPNAAAMGMVSTPSFHTTAPPRSPPPQFAAEAPPRPWQRVAHDMYEGQLPQLKSLLGFGIDVASIANNAATLLSMGDVKLHAVSELVKLANDAKERVKPLKQAIESDTAARAYKSRPAVFLKLMAVATWHDATYSIAKKYALTALLKVAPKLAAHASAPQLMVLIKVFDILKTIEPMLLKTDRLKQIDVKTLVLKAMRVAAQYGHSPAAFRAATEDLLDAFAEALHAIEATDLPTDVDAANVELALLAGPLLTAVAEVDDDGAIRFLDGQVVTIDELLLS